MANELNLIEYFLIFMELCYMYMMYTEKYSTSNNPMKSVELILDIM